MEFGPDINRLRRFAEQADRQRMYAAEAAAVGDHRAAALHSRRAENLEHSAQTVARLLARRR